MRISIILSKDEHEAREARLATAPDEFVDKATGDLAELIWEELPDDVPVEGVDLCAPDGAVLYTIVGEPFFVRG